MYPICITRSSHYTEVTSEKQLEVWAQTQVGRTVFLEVSAEMLYLPAAICEAAGEQEEGVTARFFAVTEAGIHPLGLRADGIAAADVSIPIVYKEEAEARAALKKKGNGKKPGYNAKPRVSD